MKIKIGDQLIEDPSGGFFSEADAAAHMAQVMSTGQLLDEEYYIDKYKKWAQSGSTVLPVRQKEDTNGQEH